jgi:hypothetical protein
VPHIRVTHDLDERHAAAIEVQRRRPVGVRKPFVQRLARILFEVHADDADASRVSARLELQYPLGGERTVVLRYLIALRQVGIEVVLPREHGPLVNRAPERKRRARGELHRLAVEDGERARQPETHGARVGVGRRAEARAAAAEQLGLCLQLGMDLQADDGLVRHAGGC